MKQVLVLGGGYAGLRAVKELHRYKRKEKLPIEVTLVNNNPYSYDATALETVAAGTNDPWNIMMNISDVLPKDVNFILDEVVKVNQEENTVSLKNRKEPLKFDYLFNALGFETETFGTPGVQEYALEISNIENSKEDYKTIISHLEDFQKTGNKDDLKMVVIGGGLTSAELMGELIHQIPRWAKKYGFNKKDFKLICISPNFLPMFDEKQVKYAKDYLEKHGVTFMLGEGVTKVTPDGVEYGKKGEPSKPLAAKTVFWCAGVRGNHVMNVSEYDEHRDRVAVMPDMNVKAYPNEYIIGDVSAVKNELTGAFYPTTAQIAIQEANIAVANLAATLTNKPHVPFTYDSLGTVCSLGNTSGIAAGVHMFGMFGPRIRLTGFIVPPLKNLIFKRSAFEIAGLKAALQR